MKRSLSDVCKTIQNKIFQKFPLDTRSCENQVEVIIVPIFVQANEINYVSIPTNAVGVIKTNSVVNITPKIHIERSHSKEGQSSMFRPFFLVLLNDF